MCPLPAVCRIESVNDQLEKILNLPFFMYFFQKWAKTFKDLQFFTFGQKQCLYLTNSVEYCSFIFIYLFFPVWLHFLSDILKSCCCASYNILIIQYLKVNKKYIHIFLQLLNHALKRFLIKVFIDCSRLTRLKLGNK